MTEHFKLFSLSSGNYAWWLRNLITRLCFPTILPSALCLRSRTAAAAVLGGGPPTAVAYQLPRVVISTPCLEPSQRAITRQACTDPYEQHCDHCIHQPARWSALLSQLACHFLLWSQKHLRLLHAIRILGLLTLWLTTALP